jgi:enoyl-CoA hydratase/carnithine racemase
MTGGDELLREQRGPILVLRLNRPEARNALTPSLIRSVGAAMVEADGDPSVRVVVLTGSGDRVFCAGMDLGALTDGTDMGPTDDDAWLGFTRFVRGEVSVPVVGAANGSALGGGLELLLGCDVVVVAAGAQLGLPEVKRGLIPGGSGTFLGTRIPLGLALEMTLTGDSIDARRAKEVGLANAVVPFDEVLPTALAYAQRIADNGPLGVTAVKELVRLAVEDGPRAWQRLAELRPVVFGSEDAKEGARAFMEKRTPAWQGR